MGWKHVPICDEYVPSLRPVVFRDQADEPLKTYNCNVLKHARILTHIAHLREAGVLVIFDNQPPLHYPVSGFYAEPSHQMGWEMTHAETLGVHVYVHVCVFTCVCVGLHVRKVRWCVCIGVRE